VTSCRSSLSQTGRGLAQTLFLGVSGFARGLALCTANAASMIFEATASMSLAGWRRPLYVGVCDFAKRGVGPDGSLESAWRRAHCGRARPRQGAGRVSLREIAGVENTIFIKFRGPKALDDRPQSTGSAPAPGLLNMTCLGCSASRSSSLRRWRLWR
jgi:hypothetical protein